MARTRRFSLNVRGITVEVTRRRTSRLSVRAHGDGRVTCSCPLSMGRGQVEQLLDSMGETIAALRERALGPEGERRIREAVAHLCEGGMVPIWGRERRVRLNGGAAAAIELTDDELILAADLDEAARGRALDQLLRREVSEAMGPVAARAEALLAVRASHWTVRPMVSRWGSCRFETGRITLNSDLALHDPIYLELVVCHELSHLVGHDHGPTWRAAMDRCLPGWRELQARLDEEGIRLSRP